MKPENTLPERVKAAYQEKEKYLSERLAQFNLSFQSGFYLFIRAYKQEQELEVWIKKIEGQYWQLLTIYPFSAFSGELGPKRKEGDRQIPEGFYYITHFNPQSKFHLSLRLNYPNEYDLIWADKEQPGSDIYIHGGEQTVGCIPITDDKIKELYILAWEAQKNGQPKIEVHIFPTRMTENI